MVYIQCTKVVENRLGWKHDKVYKISWWTKGELKNEIVFSHKYKNIYSKYILV
jgi:hypothetical protein